MSKHCSSSSIIMPAFLALSFLLFVALEAHQVLAFQSTAPGVSSRFSLARKTIVVCMAQADDLDLKAELQEYLEKRKEFRADDAAKEEVGKVVGGTKGNLILDYVSGSPNKEFVIEEEPNVFDYDQLTKYGFGHLVTPIMKAGGRREMYTLMGMVPPPLPQSAKPKKVPKLVIDRQGKTDKGRYTGLKMGQVLNDDEMAKALEEAQKKGKAGARLRPKIAEEEYVQPFADKRNVGPRWTPDWTPEMLDEEGRKRGKAMSWAREARAGQFVKDPAEDVVIDGNLRVYGLLTALFFAFANGRSSPMALSMIGVEDSTPILGLMQAPALAIAIAAVGSSVVSSAVLAPAKNRSRFTWAVKGFFGGPLAIMELRELDELTTQGEQ